MEAAVIMMKCPTVNKPYAVRIQKMPDGDWHRTWAFKIDEKQAQLEGYDQTPISGSLMADNGYPGCPYCGRFNFIQCYMCGRISCYDGGEGYSTCAWCGHSSLTETRNRFDVDGGAF